MPRKQYKYHYIYKTTNILNNKFYIGMHSTNNTNDGYIGSGKLLWRSINKHGKENHKCEILEFLPDRKSLKEKEAKIVNENLLQDRMCMNLVLGGEGGFDHLNTVEGIKNRRTSIDNWMKSASVAWLKKFNTDKEFHNKHIKMTIAAGKKGNVACNKKYPLGTFLGKQHTAESKQKISIANKGKLVGEKHPHYGKCWIYSLIEKRSIRILKTDLQQYLNNNWIRGRKMKFT